ncbi:MAG: hypothetical protein K6F29_01425 [Bacteroidales bacterium]|nr:hypothetical protein [Bacteroidales bacterium]
MKKGILFAGALILLLCCVIFLRIHSTPKMKIPENIQAAMVELSKWEKLPFVKIKDDHRLQTYLQSIQIEEEEVSLNDVQKEKLYQSLTMMLYAYSKGTYEGFINFRLPSGVRYEPMEREWKRITSCWFQAHPNATAKDLPSDSELYRWWLETDSRLYQWQMPTDQKVNQKNIYKDFWQGIMISEKDADKVLGGLNPVSQKKQKLEYMFQRNQFGHQHIL